MRWLFWNRTHRMVVVVVCRPRMKSSGTDTELRNSVGWRYVNKMGSHSSAGCFCCSAAAAIEIGVVCCCGCCCSFRLNERFVFVRESFTLLFGGEDETVALLIWEESDCDNDCCCCCCCCARRGLELLLIVRMGLGRGVNCRVAVDGCGGSKLDSTSSSSSSSE